MEIKPISMGTRLPALNFVDLDKIIDYPRFLLFGEQGSGKTRLAASIAAVPSIEGVFYVASDKGLESAIMYLQEYRHKFEDPETKRSTVFYVNPTDPVGDLTRVISHLQIATDREKAEQAGVKYCNAVVFDPINFLADDTVQKLSGTSDAIARGNTSDMRSATLPMWQSQGQLITAWISAVKNLPCVVITTCHIELKPNEQMKSFMPQALLPQKLSFKLPALFGEVFFLAPEVLPADPKRPGENMRVQYTCLCRPDGRTEKGGRQAKDRSDKLPTLLVGHDMTMATIYNYMYGDRKAPLGAKE